MTTPIVWQGSVVFTGATDPAQNGIATLTLTPSGGVSNLPALVQGQPGLPPTLRNINVTQYAAGTTPPASTFTLVTPGTAGTASVYDLNLNVNSGATGAAGTNGTISGASDVSGGPPGSTTDGYTLYWNNATSKWAISAAKRPYGPYNVPNTSFSAPYNSNGQTYIVATIGIPAQPYAWRPIVHAGFYATGTVNTHVDGVVRLNNSASGDIVGYGLGWNGAGPYAVTVQPAFNQNIGGTSTYGQVAANTTATIYLIATQVNSTTDSWQTINTNGYFTVEVVPT